MHETQMLNLGCICMNKNIHIYISSIWCMCNDCNCSCMESINSTCQSVIAIMLESHLISALSESHVYILHHSHFGSSVAFVDVSDALQSVCFMERRAKLCKLNHFRRTMPHLSASALEAVLKSVKEDGLPDMHSRYNMR